MRNQSLRTDFNNLRGMGEHQLNLVLTEAENYIMFLEAKEDRLTKIENRLGEIESCDLPNKDQFLGQFEEFKNA